MKNCNLLRDQQGKYQHYNQVKLINMNILQVKKYHLLIKGKQLEQAKFTYSLWGRAFEKTNKSNWRPRNKTMEEIL